MKEHAGWSVMRLMSLLSEFLYLCCTTGDQSDDMKYPDPPEVPAGGLLGAVSKKFPDFGRYASITARGGRGSTEIRNAAEDLAFFVSSAAKIKWYYEKTSKRNGVHHLKRMFADGLGKLTAELLAYCMDLLPRSA